MSEETEIKSKKKAQAEPIKATGLVLYADAGTKPNPGFAGWGIHGYLYSSTPPKKGSGNPTALPTALGYVSKVDAKIEKPVEVTPMVYYDGIGSVPDQITNNAGEVRAAKNAMDAAINAHKEHNIETVHLLTDSKYVVKGVQEYVHRWAQNGWVKADGMPISNLDDWKQLYESLNTLQEKGVRFETAWVRGHNGDVGNCLADQYATTGRRMSEGGVHKAIFAHSPADGYWGDQHERHPFINHPCSYMTTSMVKDITGEYYFGQHQKEDDTLGQRNADGAYSYVILKETDELIELIKDHVRKHALRDDILLMIRLTKLFERTTAARLKRFGVECLHRPRNDRLNFNISEEEHSKEPVVIEFNPPLIANRAVLALNVLKGLLLDWRDNPNTQIVGEDITSVLYEKDKKGDTKLSSVLGVGTTDIPVTLKYRQGEEIKEHDVKLCAGIDTPDRNALKRMEKLNPQVHVITWAESDQAFRYAVTIKCGEDLGIWAGYYSNLVYLKK